MNGFIKLHRQLIEWEWYSEMKVKTVFLHLLLTANFKDTNWRGQGIKRGQVIIGKEKLGKTLGLSIQEIKTVLKKLKKSGEITTKATNKYVIVTVCNFEAYQDKEPTIKDEATNEQPPSNQRATSEQPQRKNDKKERKEEDKRENDFLPFDVVTSRSTIEAIYQDKNLAILDVKQIYQVDVTKKDIETAMHTFSTVAIASYDAYKGIRTIEKLKNKFISWIPKSIKYQSTQKTNNIQSLDLCEYLTQFYHAGLIRRLKESGEMAKLQKQLEKESFKLCNIAKGYKNKAINTLFLFEALFLPLGRNLGGSNDTRKLESLIRWQKGLSDYNQNQGDTRKLLTERNKNLV